MVRRVSLFLIAVVFSAGSTSAQSAAPGAEAEVVAVVHQLFEGMRRVDSAMVRPLFHARARMITATVRQGIPTVQVEDSVDGFIRAIGRPRTEVFDERLSNIKVMIDGSLASVWADYVFYRGATLNHCGVDHFLLVNDGSAWKIIELSDTRRQTGCSR